MYSVYNFIQLHESFPRPSDDLLLPFVLDTVRNIMYSPPSKSFEDALKFISNAQSICYVDNPIVKEYSKQLIRHADYQDILTLAQIEAGIDSFVPDPHIKDGLISQSKGKTITIWERSLNGCSLQIRWAVARTSTAIDRISKLRKEGTHFFPATNATFWFVTPHWEYSFSGFYWNNPEKKFYYNKTSTGPLKYQMKTLIGSQLQTIVKQHNKLMADLQIV